MARRRSQTEHTPGPLVIPFELLTPQRRDKRRAWLTDRGVTTWAETWAVLVESRRAHGITEPDPRHVLAVSTEKGNTNEGLS